MASIMEYATIMYGDVAKNDLTDILAYITQKEGIGRANYVVDGIMKAAESVVPLPRKHRIEPTYNKENVRFAVKWSYKIIFLIEESQVVILRVFHTSQNPQKLK